MSPSPTASTLPPLRPMLLDDQIALAYLADKYACWLHPELVRQVADSNRGLFSLKPSDNLSPEPDFINKQYLWPGSTCFYPGTRRKIGGGERRGQYNVPYALRTDGTGNKSAEIVWERLAPNDISRPKRNEVDFIEDPGDEPEVYRNGYHLVHLFPHKPSEMTRLLKRHEVSEDEANQEEWQLAYKTGFPGLFTSAANMCLLPGELTRPTDADSKMRDVLWYRAVTIYGIEFLPPLLQPLGEKLRASPPLPNLGEEVCYIGQAQSATALLKTNNARRAVYIQALRKYQKNLLV